VARIRPAHHSGVPQPNPAARGVARRRRSGQRGEPGEDGDAGKSQGPYRNLTTWLDGRAVRDVLAELAPRLTHLAGIQPGEVAGMSPARMWAYIDYWNDLARQAEAARAAREGVTGGA